MMLYRVTWEMTVEAANEEAAAHIAHIQMDNTAIYRVRVETDPDGEPVIYDVSEWARNRHQRRLKNGTLILGEPK
jgi:hypothetical protein